jgi:glyoxylase-like metal-dependent hydrolase (beta-lactamase superfamily II)/thioredoxin-related protein
MYYFLSFIFFSVSLFGFNYHLKPYKISEGIHCFFGLPSEVSSMNGGNMINSCYVETSEGYLVIDSGPTYAYAQEAYETMVKVKKIPVKYVINTSSDEVHVLGNEFYKEMGALLIGPKGYKEHLESKGELFLSKKLTNKVMLNTRVVSLDEYITEKKLKYPNMEVDIKSLKGDENHLYLYIKEKRIVFAGDLIFNNRMVPIHSERSIIKWLESIEEVTQLDWVDIISSHGYMTRRTALDHTRSYLIDLKKRVTEYVSSGKSLEDALKDIKMSAFSKYRFYDTWQRHNVEIVYDELKDIYEFQEEKKLAVVPLLTQDIPQKKKLITMKKQAEVSAKVKTKKEILLEYRSFEQAIGLAKQKNKIVLIKVRSTICKYCDQLDRIIERNFKVRKILSQYFELVNLNVDYQSVPMDIYVRSTPTLIFIRPDNTKVLMQLTGIRALGELLDVLNEAIEDGDTGGYLVK